MGGFSNPRKLFSNNHVPINTKNLPEYPHRPAAHLKRPTAININGRISHCDTEARAGQSSEAKGYAGFKDPERVDETAEEISLPLFFLTLRRGLCGEGEGAGIVSEVLEG